MPGEIFGDIRNASDNTPTVSNNSNFAALVAQLRYTRLQVAENVVESSGEFDSLAADRVFTTAGSKKFRSYSSLPEPVSFVGIENTPPNISQTRKSVKKERKVFTSQQQDQASLVGVDTSNVPKALSVTVDAVDQIPLSCKESSSSLPTPSSLTTGEASSPVKSCPVIYHPLLDDPEPASAQAARQADSLLVDISLIEESGSACTSLTDTGGHPSTCDTPLAYDWPIEGAKMLYSSPQKPSQEGKRSSPGSVADSQDSWRISSTNAILTAPPPVTAALEAAESFVNFATASITALSTSSQEFLDRSTLSLKDAATRSHMSWQQAITKVGQALLTARSVMDTPRLAAAEDAADEREPEEEQVPPLLKRAVSISATVKSGLNDAVQQAKDILRNI